MYNFSRDTLARHRELFCCALRVAWQHKKLFWFPFFSLAGGLLLLALCATTVFHVQAQAWAHLPAGKGIGRAIMSSVAMVYFPWMTLTVFFNVACYHQIFKAFAGEPVSLGDGVRFASQRIRPILAWSLVAGSVGMAIQMLAQRLDLFGRILVRLVGYAWSVAAVFVIPIMIRENTANPLHLLRASSATVKNTWKMSLLGYAGIQFGFALFMGLVITAGTILYLAGSAAGWGDNPEVVVSRGLLFGGVVMLAAFFFSAINDIYRCALYVYASEGVVPAPFSEDQMELGWRVGGGKS